MGQIANSEDNPSGAFPIFEILRLQGTPPKQAAKGLGFSRGVVDNNVYKVMQRLREIATAPEYQSEYYL